jgi:GcrA cell cycle regulator
MEQGSWAPEHSDALRECVGRSMSYSEIAEAINAKFGTSYSRNAAIGRAKRMGLGGPPRPGSAPCEGPRRGSLPELRSVESRMPEFRWPIPPFEPVDPVRLRCVDIEPRHLALVELEAGDCHYPYGGDVEGEAITFCGHQRRAGSSYCTPHFHLSRNSGVGPERFESTASLTVVEAA